MTGDDDRPARGAALRVLVVSTDRAYLRFACAVLGNAGHRTVRAHAPAGRMQALARLHDPGVVVLDAGDDALLVAEVCLAVCGPRTPVGLVLVSDAVPAGAGLRVVPRWCPARMLLEAVGGVRAGPDPRAPAGDGAGARALMLVPASPR